MRAVGPTARIAQLDSRQKQGRTSSIPASGKMSGKKEGNKFSKALLPLVRSFAGYPLRAGKRSAATRHSAAAVGRKPPPCASFAFRKSLATEVRDRPAWSIEHLPTVRHSQGLGHSLSRWLQQPFAIARLTRRLLVAARGAGLVALQKAHEVCLAVCELGDAGLQAGLVGALVDGDAVQQAGTGIVALASEHRLEASL